MLSKLKFLYEQAFELIRVMLLSVSPVTCLLRSKYNCYSHDSSLFDMFCCTNLNHLLMISHFLPASTFKYFTSTLVLFNAGSKLNSGLLKAHSSYTRKKSLFSYCAGAS